MKKMQPNNYCRIMTMQQPSTIFLFTLTASTKIDPLRPNLTQKNSVQKYLSSPLPSSPPSMHFSTARTATMTSRTIGPTPIGRAPTRVDAVVSTQRHQRPHASRASTDPIGTDGSPRRRILASKRTICRVMMVISPVTLLMMMKMIF